MNYCTNCGSPLKSNSNFCTECGAKITKRKQEKDYYKITLITGIFLVIFASFLLGIVSWKNMSESLRITFFALETGLFFGLSYATKKLGSILYKLFFIAGLILIPFTLSMFPYYGLLPGVLNTGSGPYVYLAVIYALTSIFYWIINKKFENPIVDIMSLIALLISFVFCGCIINLSIEAITFAAICYALLISLIPFLNIFNKRFLKISKIVSMIILIIIPIMILATFMDEGFKMGKMLWFIMVVIYCATSYIKIISEKEIAYKVIAPFTLFFTVDIYLITIFIGNTEGYLYSLLIAPLILYLIAILFKDKYLSITTLCLTTVQLIIVLFDSYAVYNLYLLAFLTSGILLLLNILNIIYYKYKELIHVIPATIFLTVLTFLKLFVSVEMTYILLGVGIVYLISYLVLKTYGIKQAITFLIYSLILVYLSVSETTFGVNCLISFILLIIFITSLLYKENKVFSAISFVLFNLSALHLVWENPIGNEVYYTLLSLAGITLLLSVPIMKKLSINMKPYILYSQIVLLIITLFNSLDSNWLILGINFVLYALSFVAVTKYFNYKAYRVLYIMVALITLTRIIALLSVPVAVSLSFAIISIFLVVAILYYLNKEEKFELAVISLTALFPYYVLLHEYFDILDLYIIPLIIYTLVLSELHTFKNYDNKLSSTIVPLAVLTFVLLISKQEDYSIIIHLAISLGYILYGAYKKYNSLLYLGITFIGITLIIKLFAILDNVALIVVLIIIGFILIGVALHNEIKKKNKE